MGVVSVCVCVCVFAECVVDVRVVCERSVEGKRLYLLHIMMMMMMMSETRSLWVRCVRWLDCDGLAAAAAAAVSTCVCGDVRWLHSRELWRYRSVYSGVCTMHVWRLVRVMGGGVVWAVWGRECSWAGCHRMVSRAGAFACLQR